MKIIILVLLAGLGLTIGYNVSKIVDEAVIWKEKQNNKTYTLHRNEYNWDKWVNGILISAGFGLGFYYFGLYKAIFSSIMLVLAVFGARLDQRIRIIPNELVLLIFGIGLIHQLVTNGLKGIGSGFLALLITGVIFFLSAFITRLLSGSIGVGAGDIKLAMALSMIMGMENIFLFLIGIVFFLAFYILAGFLMRTISIGNTFPMCTQIMGGAMVALYYPVILQFVELIK